MEDKELTQWEYKEVNFREVNEKNLNELGKQGWELAATEQGGSCIMKRPKVKQKEPVGYSH